MQQIKLQDFIKSAKILIGIKKQGGLINRMKNALLKLFNIYKQCFIKLRKTNDYSLKKLL